MVCLAKGGQQLASDIGLVLLDDDAVGNSLVGQEVGRFHVLFESFAVLVHLVEGELVRLVRTFAEFYDVEAVAPLFVPNR